MPFDPTSVLTYTKVWPASTSADTIQVGPGALYDLELCNSDSIGYWVKLFDVATGSLTIGSTTANIGSFYVPTKSDIVVTLERPRNFANNCFVSVTQNAATSDTIAPNASVVVINCGYR